MSYLEPDTRTAAEKALARDRDTAVQSWAAQTMQRAIADPTERADHLQLLALLRTHTCTTVGSIVTVVVHCYPWPGTTAATATATATATGATSASAAGSTPAAAAGAGAGASVPVASLTVRSAHDNRYGTAGGGASNQGAGTGKMLTVRWNDYTGVLTDATFSPGAFERVYQAMRVPAAASAHLRVMHVLNSVAAFAIHNVVASTAVVHAATDRTSFRTGASRHGKPVTYSSAVGVAGKTTGGDVLYQFLRRCVPDAWLDADSTDALPYDVWKRFQYLTTVTDQSLRDWPTDVIGLVRDYLCPALQGGTAADVAFKRPGSRVGYENDHERYN